jgi:hypothetical protein
MVCRAALSVTTETKKFDELAARDTCGSKAASQIKEQ